MGRRIRFTNNYEHQSDSRYMVYEFFHLEHADHFEQMLIDRQVEFERHFDEEESPPITLFGIQKRYVDLADKCNYLTHAKYRKPLIRNSGLKWLMLIVVGSMITIALIGYFKSR